MSTQTAPDIDALVGELLARRSWSRDRLVAHVSDALRALLRHAVSASPYYRETLGPLAGEREIVLEELPTLPKQTLMEEWDRIVTDPRLRLGDAERFLEGRPGLHLDEYRVFVTGGSTGTRGIFVSGRGEFAMTMAGMLRTVVDTGIRPETRLASIGSPSPFHLSNQVFAAFRSGRDGSPRLDVTMPLGDIVGALNAYRPEAILTYPTILGLLADEQIAGRLDIAPTMLGTGSEVLSEEVRARADDAWGTRVVDVYVSTEAGMMASEVDGGEGPQIWEDTVILEPVDEQNRPVAPGIPSHKVLLTNLWYRAQPLIRYELADSITLAMEDEPDGRPFRRITRIDGRSADILRLAARDGGEVAVPPFHVRSAFGRIAEVRQYQLRQTPDGFHALVVLTPGSPRDTPERVRAALASAFEKAGALCPSLDVEAVDAIARQGTGAKLPLIAAAARETAAVG